MKDKRNSCYNKRQKVSWWVPFFLSSWSPEFKSWWGNNKTLIKNLLDKGGGHKHSIESCNALNIGF
jgi:hypothetical protein